MSNEEHYPWPNDPRRSADWGTRTSEAEQLQLLGAILDVLIEINAKLAAARAQGEK